MSGTNGYETPRITLTGKATLSSWFPPPTGGGEEKGRTAGRGRGPNNGGWHVFVHEKKMTPVSFFPCFPVVGFSALWTLARARPEGPHQHTIAGRVGEKNKRASFERGGTPCRGEKKQPLHTFSFRMRQKTKGAGNKEREQQHKKRALETKRTTLTLNVGWLTLGHRTRDAFGHTREHSTHNVHQHRGGVTGAGALLSPCCCGLVWCVCRPNKIHRE